MKRKGHLRDSHADGRIIYYIHFIYVLFKDLFRFSDSTVSDGGQNNK
jgi:hypothetical protein